MLKDVIQTVYEKSKKEWEEKEKKDKTVIKITDDDDKKSKDSDLSKGFDNYLYQCLENRGLLYKDSFLPFLKTHFEDRKKAEKEHNAARKCEHMAKYIRDSIDRAAKKENVSWRDELKSIQDYIQHNLV